MYPLVIGDAQGNKCLVFIMTDPASFKEGELLEVISRSSVFHIISGEAITGFFRVIEILDDTAEYDAMVGTVKQFKVQRDETEGE